jgi:hypothetical protein
MNKREEFLTKRLAERGEELERLRIVTVDQATEIKKLRGEIRHLKKEAYGAYK